MGSRAREAEPCPALSGDRACLMMIAEQPGCVPFGWVRFGSFRDRVPFMNPSTDQVRLSKRWQRWQRVLVLQLVLWPGLLLACELGYRGLRRVRGDAYSGWALERELRRARSSMTRSIPDPDAVSYTHLTLPTKA